MASRGFLDGSNGAYYEPPKSSWLPEGLHACWKPPRRSARSAPSLGKSAWMRAPIKESRVRLLTIPNVLFQLKQQAELQETHGSGPWVWPAIANSQPFPVDGSQLASLNKTSILIQFLEGFIYAKWCRISSTRSTSKTIDTFFCLLSRASLARRRAPARPSREREFGIHIFRNSTYPKKSTKPS